MFKHIESQFSLEKHTKIKSTDGSNSKLKSHWEKTMAENLWQDIKTKPSKLHNDLELNALDCQFH